MEISKDKLIEMFKTMVRIRIFEERATKEFLAGHIPGFIHTYIGEEASATGAIAALEPDDYVSSTHRGHGHLIAKGGKTDRMMAELYGKRAGYNKGKGGSMHIADMEINMLGANSIVGAGIPITAGAALSAQMRGTKQVAVCFFGDGASNRGTFHEGINLAACWNLPVIFVCENNLYGESTPFNWVCKLDNVADRAGAYGIPGVAVDGNDVLAVYEAMSAAAERARRGDGPSLLETKTYRLSGHFVGDQEDKYRTKEEVEGWRKKDPIPRFEKYLIDRGVLTGEEVARIKQDTLQELDAAVKFADESPLPEPEEALEDVFAQGGVQ
ncbi:thiamine pyrophosphate-dependent dehydrogenase E1 component subunit alpha [Chloroflexota bacterium]